MGFQISHWKRDTAPPHSPRLLPSLFTPPQAAEQTGKPVGTTRDVLGECGAAMRKGRGSDHTVLHRLRRKRAGGLWPEHATPGPFFTHLLHRATVQVWIEHEVQSLIREATQVARLEDLCGPQNGNKLLPQPTVKSGLVEVTFSDCIDRAPWRLGAPFVLWHPWCFARRLRERGERKRHSQSGVKPPHSKNNARAGG